MNCPACNAFESDERAVLEEREQPDHASGLVCTCLSPAYELGEIAITWFTTERFHAERQVGIPIRQEWHSLVRALTWPAYGADKKSGGAWCPCALDDGIVKGGTGPVSLLVADVDDCGAGAIARSAEVLAPYLGAVIPTFSATPQQEKHRIVLVPSRELVGAEFPLAWQKMAGELASADIVVDRGCKNRNRLYFACVTRSPETWMGARLLTGKPVPVDAMVSAAQAEEQARKKCEPPPRPVAEQHRDKYIAAAITLARGNVASASEGGRHDTLLRESYALARFDFIESEIAGALLEAFVSAAGEHRRREGERAIHDAVAARRKGVA
jgi:hypothetical protein